MSKMTKSALAISSEQLRYHLYDENLTPKQIATKYNTYTNKIRRLAAEYGIPLRTRAEAIKNALETGTLKHPTKGKPRSDSFKRRIGETTLNYWQTLETEQLENRQKKAKDQWEKMNPNKREKFITRGRDAVRETAKSGSKLECVIAEGLREAGYNVIQHSKSLEFGEQLELDILVPEAATVIEIDGPSHFLPIWGDDALLKTIESDMKKNGLILSAGYTMIRVKCISRTESFILQEELVNRLIEIIETQPKKLIEVEF